MKLRLRLFLSALCLAGPSCAEKSAPTASAPVRRVVLVHGFMDTGSIFKPLKNRLESRGCECYAPQMNPSDGRGGLEKLAVRLKQDIDKKFGPTAPVSIVAFSMGGIVTRQYLQNLGGAARCENLITISSPHHGSKVASLYPSKGSQEMRPGSRFLAELQKSEDKLGKIPITSYRTPMDLMIFPSSSSIWERAENIAYPVLLHPLMLTSDLVLSDIENRLGKPER
jgi:triacylglycerol lipase